MGNDKILKSVLDGRRKYLSKVQGSLIGGAAGDALGYTVEFVHYYDIRRMYGPAGITEFETDHGYAHISDDTQMTMFTASGLLYGETRMMLQGNGNSPHTYVPFAYRDWLYTQDKRCKPDYITSWLVSIPELHNRRAPGTTCMSALSSGKIGSMNDPLNNSCGCGGVMRAAPVGLFYGQYYDQLSDENLIRAGAETAAITHGHPWGYIPAGMLSLLIKKAAFSSDKLHEIVTCCLEETGNVFGENKDWAGFERVIQKAIDFSHNDKNDFDNIRNIGEGWVGHEALAIAIYAALRYEFSFSDGIIAAVNHDGDSDSTGSICGNILGAYLGMEGIDGKWQEKLELKDTILELGTDLCDHCHMDESGNFEDPNWLRKYVDICGLNGEAA